MGKHTSVLISAVLLVVIYAVTDASAGNKTLAPLKWRFAYDDSGRISKLIDPGNKITTFSYELDKTGGFLKKVTKAHVDGAEVSFGLDRFGQRRQMIDAYGKVVYEYDNYNHITGIHREGSPKISYTYDTMDRLSSMNIGKIATVRYVYDFLGRPSKIETPVGSIIYQYQDGQGQISRILPNGIRTILKYMPNGSLDSIINTDRDNHVISRFTYSYRPDGLIDAVKEWSPRVERVIQYQYDQVKRLTAVVDSTGQKIQYQYDKLGNRLSMVKNGKTQDTLSYNWAGQIKTRNGQICTYDASGNLTSYKDKGSNVSFGFNSVNLPKSVQKSGVKIDYEYDGDGYMIARIAAGKKTSYVPDPFTDIWRPILALNADGGTTYFVWEGGVPLMAVSGGKVKFFLHDHLGSVRCISDQNGRITKRFDYSPFGVPQTGFDGDGLQPGFAGLFLEPVATLYLTRARVYDPAIGRFMQFDPQHRIPLGSQKELFGYNYCGGDPVNFVDSNGAFAVKHGERINNTYFYVLEQPGGGLTIGVPTSLRANMWPLTKHYAQEKVTKGIVNILEASGKFASANALRMYSTATAPISIGKIGAESVVKSLDSEMSITLIKWAHDFTKVGEWKSGLLWNTWHIPDARNIQNVEVAAFLHQAAQMHDAGMPSILTAFQNSGNFEKQKFWMEQTGYNSEGLNKILNEWSANDSQAMVPSNVGGVYLQGAGDALKHLGQLRGVAVDKKTGRLALLSEGDSKINLSPLRMDDVVTVFRSVYENGAPYVSIDPDPKNPRGPVMLVRHDPVTKKTYPGWILFETDRLMKAYSLGFDNLSRKQLKSEIKGYTNLFDLGFSNFGNQEKDSIWERFWIVPSKIKRRQSVNSELTLLDVSLKVNTQRMVMHGGKLEPAPGKGPSKQAKTFSEWFTNAYDDISKEALSAPPEGADDSSPVEVFVELRRIALITAIAETLRNQDVPLPSWMRNYPVKPCKVPLVTPSIVVEATQTETKKVRDGASIRELKSTQRQRIYGGVNLAPDDKDVQVVKGDLEAEEFIRETSAKIVSAPLASPISFRKNEKKYQILALPGDRSKDLGAKRLNEIDLIVPVQRGTNITLSRVFNSFFRPEGDFGKGWTSDFPQLVKQKLLVSRTGDKTVSKNVYQLTSPLSTVSGSFKKYKFVPEMNGKLLVDESSDIFYGLADKTIEKIGFETKVLIYRDGREWLFDKGGNLVAKLEGPLMTIYRRDNAHLVRRIEGWYGKHLRADIKLEYDDLGRIKQAFGSNNAKVEYQYGGNGSLSLIRRPDGTLEYKNKDGLVVTVLLNGKEISRFDYGDHGQLLSERLADGTKRTLNIKREKGTVKIAKVSGNDSISAEYDSEFRPIKRIFEDGTQVQWKYKDTTSVDTDIALPDGNRYKVNSSSNGKQMAFLTPGGGKYSTSYDSAGRLVALHRDNKEIIKRKWHTNGLPASTVHETFATHPEYRDDNVQTGVLLTPPKESPFKEWLRINYDELGRPDTITDATGSETKIGYDQTGEPGIVVTKRGGVKLDRDENER